MTEKHREQEIRVGQVWRRKRDGKTIRIARQRATTYGPHDDWRWVGESYTGRGLSYGSYIRRDYELVKDVD